MSTEYVVLLHDNEDERAEDTDWVAIAALYAELESATGSPVVRLARAVAVMEATGPEDGLLLLDGLSELIPGHHRLPAVRAELLVRAGRISEARGFFETTIALCGNDAERRHLQRRLGSL